jgi:hypothetical protein
MRLVSICLTCGAATTTALPDGEWEALAMMRKQRAQEEDDDEDTDEERKQD